MTKGEIVNVEAFNAYAFKMAQVADDLHNARELTKRAWWALHEIDRDCLYKTAHGWSKGEWVADLATHYGISRGDFYNVMGMVENLKALRLSDETIQSHLGAQLTALKVDLAKVMRNGKLLPEVAERVKEEYGTPGRMIAAMATMPPGEARKVVKELTASDQIFVLDDSALYNPARKELLFNARWDDGGGLVGIYTVRVTVENITEGGVVKDRKLLPERLAMWIGNKFGVKI